MTNEQLLDSVAVIAKIALEAGVKPSEVLRVVQEACVKRRTVLYSAAVRKVIERIDRDYARKLTLEGLAREAFIDSSYLGNIFKKEVGLNISQYIINTRVQKSKLHLYNQALTIKEVAKLSGFSDASYYSRLFKEIEGLSPRDFRHQRHEK